MGVNFAYVLSHPERGGGRGRGGTKKGWRQPALESDITDILCRGRCNIQPLDLLLRSFCNYF